MLVLFQQCFILGSFRIQKRKRLERLLAITYMPITFLLKRGDWLKETQAASGMTFPELLILEGVGGGRHLF